MMVLISHMKGAWIQVTFDKHIHISALKLQGSKDEDRWVETFNVAYAKDETNAEFVKYYDHDGKLVSVLTVSAI